MISIEKKNIEMLAATLKGIVPANYPSMDRLVSCVQYLEGLLQAAEEKPSEEVVKDG